MFSNALSPPNLLTYARLALTPFIVYAAMRQRCGTALAFIAVAGFTDFVDGLIARRFGWQTRLGAYLDPVADKILLTAVYVSLAIAGLAPVWLVWLIVMRDVAILLMAAAALAFTRFRDFPPSIWGKINTALEIGTAFMLLAECAAAFHVPAMLEPAMIRITAVSTAWSGLHYVGRALKMLK